MQKQTSNNQSQSLDSQIQLQQKKQILNIIFTKNINENIQILQQNLTQYYQHNQHYQQLINHAFRNPFYQLAKVYTNFFKEKYPQNKQPRISEYYDNELFPNFKILGQYRKQPSKYPHRIISPLKQNLFEDLENLFEEYQYVPNLQRFLIFFPQFLLKLRILEKELFQHSKFDQQTSYFLALCAAMQNGCPYMINRMVIKFLSKGGKLQWIKQKKYPIKISKVLQLNRILLRRIWQITSDDIQQIVQEGYWNLNQVALIIQIFSFIHSLSVITLSLGLKPQKRSSQYSTQFIQKLLKQYQLVKIESANKNKPLKQVLPFYKALKQNIQIVKKKAAQPQILQMQAQSKKSSNKSSFHNYNKQQRWSKQQNSSQQQKIQQNKTQQDKQQQQDKSQQDTLYMRQIGIQLTQQKLICQIMKKLFVLPQFQPIQKRRDTKYNQFICSQFNLQIKMLPRLLSMITVTQSTKKMSSLIEQGQQMNLKNFGEYAQFQSKQIRKAQRYYAQNLCGFVHPEYDYKKCMSDILTMPFKFYIRILMLSPLHMKRQIIDQINHQKGQIQLFDFGHTAILIALTKLKMCLTLPTHYFDY